MRRLFVGCAGMLFVACGSSPATQTPNPGTTASFDFSADLTSDFYAMPYPSDLRLRADGTPDLSGFPNQTYNKTVAGMVTIAEQRHGFPVIPVGYFHFDAPLAELDSEKVIDATKTSPVLLVDVDPGSPSRGKLFPTVATTPPVDDYVPTNLLAVAPRPGFVLEPHRLHAFVVLRSLGDKAGKPLGVPSELTDLEQGNAPAGPLGSEAVKLYQPLWDTLATIGVSTSDVAAATVFTTGDVVADLAALSDKVIAKYSITVDGLKVNPDDGAAQDRYCELLGTVTYPQFQVGKPPFDTQGLFDIGADGLPVLQREEKAPITITFPKGEMPASGYPLAVYFHGSGGLSTEVVDRGRIATPNGMPAQGEGPAYVLAPFGIAMAGSAMPLNPERLPGATEIEYLNFSNLPAFRDTFHQGVIEQRLFFKALEGLTVDPSVVATCSGLSLPKGASAYRFNPQKLLAQGQSMGAMYANMISAVEPRVSAVLPTGSGGFWSYFILKTSLIPNAAGLIGEVVFGTQAKLTFLHPALMLGETAWEPSDPFVYMRRLGQRPLPGHPTRPIYEPVAKGDSYFPMELYDAIALSYAHEEAGQIVWGSMQEALKLASLDGIVPYSVVGNRKNLTNGDAYTGVIVQYEGDGIYDPHSIFSQLDSVKYQYGCFFSTFLEQGKAVVPAVAPLGSPCPTK